MCITSKQEKKLIRLKIETINSIKNDKTINPIAPITAEKLEEIFDYFDKLEVSLVQEIEENNELNVSRTYLEEVCNAADDLNIESDDEFDIDYINKALGF